MKKMIFIVICLALSGCVQKGVLFGELVDDEWVWFKNGDENTYSKYEGVIRKEVPNGQGTLISPDGRKYVGEFRNGKFYGQGTRTFPDGRKYIGEFREGRPWNITHYDKNGNIIVKFVNGVEKAPEASEEPAVEVKCRRVESLAEGASVIGSAVSDVKITNALNMLLDDGRKGNNRVNGHTIYKKEVSMKGKSKCKTEE